MPKISEILAIEKERAPREKWNVVHLFKDGSFYRAYEWSAWLIVTALANDPEKKLSVSRRGVKNGNDTFALLGFPLNSMAKFIPNVTPTPVNDSQLDFIMPLEFPQDATLEAVVEAFKEWKESVPVSEDKKKKSSADNSEGRPQSITGVMRQIIAWPLEAKTPMENMAFIARLKQELADLI